ncbi:hypothetical protein F9B85_01855 [Heliorestis acidaminivorans]|uniref:Nucleoside transporter/FeoB GTPase Gate domain-containing protein n=1 Tax=Heliorestis acidaminivorans TaxID=553427 RepID=A0A6I0F648_9FIRM|nr:nucleoside recognition domain-containing protein [Heliorestis acidaminivorans]KAB2954452.1 hypothetical protein F9B85_01855 [Heliorestis acidaminivorans]
MQKRILFFFVLFIFFLAPLMVYYPQESLAGAKDGLHLWLTVALPALFPFMVVAELIIRLGLPPLLGLLFEPMMRPLFRLPGPAGVVVAVGFTTGFPIGAIMTTRFIQEGLLTRQEGERLALFTNNASPLFLLGVVGTALFGHPEIGLLIACSHYGANLILGILFAFLDRKRTVLTVPAKVPFSSRMKAEWKRFLLNDSPPGEIIGQSIVKAMNNAIAIGGYLIFFTVVFRLFLASGVLNPLILFMEKFLMWFRFEPALAQGLLAGLMEMTLGSQQIVATSAPLIDKVLLISFILAWSGLSIQAQVATFLLQSGVPVHRYITARLMQGFLALAISYLLFHLWPLPLATVEVNPSLSSNLWSFWPGIIGLFYTFLGFFLLFLVFARKRLLKSL